MTTSNSQVIPLRLWQTQNQQLKRIRKISKQTVVNKSRRSKFKNAIKKMNLLLDSKKKKEVLAFLPKLSSELMKVVKTGVIKKKNASRNISRITKKINAL